DKWNIADAAADYLYTPQPLSFALPGTLKVILPAPAWGTVSDKDKYLPLFDMAGYLAATQRSASINFVSVNVDHLPEDAALEALAADPTVVLSLWSANAHAMPAVRRFLIGLQEKQLPIPAILECRAGNATPDAQLIHFAVETGALLLDGFGDGLWLRSASTGHPALLNNVAFGILQATRTRISKTEYISCPSCGRTLFDLQETTARIRAVTHHLKGVKIAIMGCIVNGPGEMADADFGYVGSGVGKITLYRGKEIVKRGLSSDVAVDELIDLIKDHGMWVEKVTP
ncbi:MAG TPA: flavodoxin-dependent (E)-4-hydroxy-3-methylbut-2-enyl-diphosphate synthase, partial [Chitinophaga sp.]